jgi:hypothetical protein
MGYIEIITSLGRLKIPSKKIRTFISSDFPNSDVKCGDLTLRPSFDTEAISKKCCQQQKKNVAVHRFSSLLSVVARPCMIFQHNFQHESRKFKAGGQGF